MLSTDVTRITENPVNNKKIKAVFETSRGSIYYLDEDGGTTRFKSFHTGHGKEEQGWKSTSKNTLCINKTDAIKIGEATINKTGFVILEETHNSFSLYLVYRDRRTGEIKPDFVNVDFQGRPEIGLCPLELHNLEELPEGLYNPSDVHPGNPIVEFHK